MTQKIGATNKRGGVYEIAREATHEAMRVCEISDGTRLYYIILGAIIRANATSLAAQRERDAQETEAQCDALQSIAAWCSAYPDDVFPDQDMKKAREVLEANGISIGAMHGQWARHIVKGIGEIASAAIRQQDKGERE
jgi:hypothetical protein